MSRPVHYAASCPACGIGVIVVLHTRVENACLHCGCSDAPSYPPEGNHFFLGGRDSDREKLAILRDGLARIARGSRPAVEASWYESIAWLLQSMGDIDAAVRALREAITELWPHRDRGVAGVARLAMTFAGFARTGDDRVHALSVLVPLIELCTELRGEDPVLAHLLATLAYVLGVEGHRDQQARRALERARRIYEQARDPADDPAAWDGIHTMLMSRTLVPGSPRMHAIAGCEYALLPIYASLGLTAEQAACEARLLELWGPVYGEDHMHAMLDQARKLPES